MIHESANPYESPTTGTGLHQNSDVRRDLGGANSATLYPSTITMFALILGAAATRLAPHWWNLTAVGAVCLFGGAYFQRKWAAFLVPLAALAISDALLQTFVYRGYGPNYFKYVCFALTVPLGFLLRGRTTLLPVMSSAIGATVLFFLLSNFQVWLSGNGRLYPQTPAGLVACYVAALPFALNMLYGNLLFTALLFGGMEFVTARRGAGSQPADGRVVSVA
jgi:uncharacterized protein DUF6580